MDLKRLEHLEVWWFGAPVQGPGEELENREIKYPRNFIPLRY